MWSFMTGIQRDMQKQKATLMQGVAGVERQSTKNYRQLNDKVKRAVAGFGRTEILTYLHAIAFVSYL